MIAVDFSGVAIAAIQAEALSGENITLELTRHKVLNSIRSCRVRFHRKFGEIVLCFDSKNLWRKTIYPYYKATRKKMRDDSDVDWTTIYEYIETLTDEFSKNLPYKCIKVDTCEADDIISVLSRKTPGPHLIYSSDKDFIQLLSNPMISLFSPRKEEYITHENPDYYLFYHIIKGDVGDGVTNILSDTDTLITECKRQKPVFDKKILEWYDNRSLIPDIQRFELNESVISLYKIPEEIENSILDKYTHTEVGKRMNLLPYFLKYKLDFLSDRISDF